MLDEIFHRLSSMRAGHDSQAGAPGFAMDHGPNLDESPAGCDRPLVDLPKPPVHVQRTNVTFGVGTHQPPDDFRLRVTNLVGDLDRSEGVGETTQHAGLQEERNGVRRKQARPPRPSRGMIDKMAMKVIPLDAGVREGGNMLRSELLDAPQELPVDRLPDMRQLRRGQ
jgi:hypothetical protein